VLETTRTLGELGVTVLMVEQNGHFGLKARGSRGRDGTRGARPVRRHLSGVAGAAGYGGAVLRHCTGQGLRRHG